MRNKNNIGAYSSNMKIVIEIPSTLLKSYGEKIVCPCC